MRSKFASLFHRRYEQSCDSGEHAVGDDRLHVEGGWPRGISGQVRSHGDRSVKSGWKNWGGHRGQSDRSWGTMFLFYFCKKKSSKT